MELIVAFVLFVGLIASWLLLPGSTSATETPEQTETASAGRSTATQPA
jgi:hypothetical protein